MRSRVWQYALAVFVKRQRQQKHEAASTLCSITTLPLHVLWLVLSGSHVSVGKSAGHKDRFVHGEMERALAWQEIHNIRHKKINVAHSSCVP